MALTESSSDLNALLWGSSQFARGANCRAFLLRNAQAQGAMDNFGADHLYGVCVTTSELGWVKLTPDDGSKSGKSQKRHSGPVPKPALEEHVQVSAPTCLCFITSLPFFGLFWDLCFAVLSLLRVQRLQDRTISPSASAISSGRTPLTSCAAFVQSPQCLQLFTIAYIVEVTVKMLTGGHKIVIPVPCDLPAVEFIIPSGVMSTGSAFAQSLSPVDHGSVTSLGTHSLVTSLRQQTSGMLARWCCTLAFSVASADTLVSLLELLLSEHKIVVVDPNLALSSACVLALTALLEPLSWVGVLLPVLPNRMLDILDAPVPVLLGVQSLLGVPSSPSSSLPEASSVALPAEFLLQHPDTAVWFPSQDQLVTPADFVSSMPGRPQLATVFATHLIAFANAREPSSAAHRSSVSSGSSQFKLSALLASQSGDDIQQQEVAQAIEQRAMRSAVPHTRWRRALSLTLELPYTPSEAMVQVADRLLATSREHVQRMIRGSLDLRVLLPGAAGVAPTDARASPAQWVDLTAPPREVSGGSVLAMADDSKGHASLAPEQDSAFWRTFVHGQMLTHFLHQRKTPKGGAS